MDPTGHADPVDRKGNAEPTAAAPRPASTTGLSPSENGGAQSTGSAQGGGFEPSRRPFFPTRSDYAAFRETAAARGESVGEPNYLPFMAHRFEAPGVERDMVLFCRWPDHRQPIAVHIETPEVAPTLQDGGEYHQPESYVAAAEDAFATWENALEGVVRFERVDRPEDADLRLRLLGGRGPDHGGGTQVLGSTPILRACRVTGGDAAEGRLEVDFDVPWVEVYIADRDGLLEPRQVGGVALHEIGHALGMRSHSPIPAHLMFGETHGRPYDQLAPADIESFKALYSIPNGTVYARVRKDAGIPPAPRPSARPALDDDPLVDRTLGFSLRVPETWQTVREPQGVVLIDGVVWDYEASFAVTVRGYQSVEGYLEANRRRHIAGGVVQGVQTLEVAGREAQSMVVYRPRTRLVQRQIFLDTGDGRVLILTSEAPAESAQLFEPWFEAIRGSLELREAAPRG